MKTRPLDESIRDDVRSLVQTDPPSVPSQLSARDAALSKYFPPRNLRSLVGIRTWIDDHFGLKPRAHEFLKVALLSILEECSDRKKDGNGLATRRSRVDNPWTLFREQVELMLSDVARLPDESVPSASYHMNAVDIASAAQIAQRTFRVPLGSVVFSPPYPNSFDYFESYKLELLFGRFFTPEEFQAARVNLIRNYRQSGISTPSENALLEQLIQEIHSRIPEKAERTGVRDSRSRLLPNLLRGYFDDMTQFLRAAFKVMPEGTFMHIVVDQSAYLGVPIPTDLLLGDIGARVGFDFGELLLCRPARTSPQQAAEQPVLKETLRESVVVLRKP